MGTASSGLRITEKRAAGGSTGVTNWWPGFGRPVGGCPGSGVGGAVGVVQAGGRHVRVDLRRAEAAVAEQFLDTADVGPGVEQVGGKAMAKRVRAGPRVQA